MSEPRTSSKTDLILGTVVVMFLFAAIAVLVGVVAGVFDVPFASTTISGLAAIGTLLLAGATVFSIRQTRTELIEIRKDRQKPLIVDEIESVIQPSIDALQSNIEYLRDDSNKRWVYHRGRDTTSYGESPSSLIYTREFDPVSITRFSDEATELLTRMDAHDWFLEYLSNVAEEIVDQVDDDLRTVFDSSPHTEGVEYESNRLVIISAMLKQLDHFGEDHELYEFWEANRGELEKVLEREAGDLRDELNAGEELLLEFSNELFEGLVHRRHELQRDYGISKSDFESDSQLFDGV